MNHILELKVKDRGSYGKTILCWYRETKYTEIVVPGLFIAGYYVIK